MQIGISSGLNAIYEKEEEEITETIKNSSTRHKNQAKQPSNELISSSNSPIPLVKSLNFGSQVKSSSVQGTPQQQSLEGSSLIQIQCSSSRPLSICMNNIDLNDKSKELGFSNQSTLIIYPEKGKYFMTNLNRTTYKEVFNYYSSVYILLKAKNSQQIPIAKKSDSAPCCIKKLMYQYMSRYRLDSELHSDRELLLYVADIAYDSNNKLHRKMIQTIYQSISKESNDYFKGDNEGQVERDQDKEWEMYFDTDRGGIYAMIQMLFIIEKYPRFAQEIAELCNNDTLQTNCFVKVLSSITVLCLKNINDNELNVYFNQKKNILEALCEFYIGFICQIRIYLSKIQSRPLAYSDITNAFERTRLESISTPSSIFWKYEQFKEVYHEDCESFLLTKSCAGL